MAGNRIAFWYIMPRYQSYSMPLRRLGTYIIYREVRPPYADRKCNDLLDTFNLQAPIYANSVYFANSDFKWLAHADATQA
jgi:hypothetical protein